MTYDSQKSKRQELLLTHWRAIVFLMLPLAQLLPSLPLLPRPVSLVECLLSSTLPCTH